MYVWINPLPQASQFQVIINQSQQKQKAALQTPGAVVVEGEMMIGGQEHFYLEPNATLAIPGEVSGWGWVVYACVW